MKLKLTAEAGGFLLLLALLLFSFFYKLSLQPVYTWDEARRANDALQMWLQDVWVIDFYDNDPTTRGTKSPLLLWLQVASFELFGVTDWALRFPSAVASVSVGVLLWFFAYRYFRSGTLGVLAGAVFASTLALVLNHAGRTADYDIFLTLFVTAYALCFFMHLQTGQNKWWRWCWPLLTLAVLIKGVAGLFFVPGLALYALQQKHFKTLLQNKWSYGGLLFFVLVVAGYYALREWHAPGFLQAVYNNELGGRYLEELEENGQPLLFYISNFTWRYPFWLYLAGPAFLLGWLHSSPAFKRWTRFNLILCITFLIIISSSKTKLYWYDVPLYPLLALQIGAALFYSWQWLQQQLRNKTSQAVQLAIALTLLVLLFAAPFSAVHHHITKIDKGEGDYQQAYFLKKALQHKKDLNNYTLLYEDYDRHIRYYAKRLQEQQVRVRVSNAVNGLKPGSFVVVSEDSTREKLLELYEVSAPVERYDCQVFYIKGLKSDATNLATVKK